MSPVQTSPTAFSTLDDAALALALREQGLGLSVDEARRVCEQIGRDPTVVEARIFDTMWSEHCSYKSSRRVLRRLPTAGADVVLGPGEDAGVVRLGEHDGHTYCVVLAHESHNHPSQVMPVEGAATGIGGIVRDVFCMGAEVVGVMDALRFGDPHGATAARVRDIAGGVVQGIMEYGNPLGVPNLGGDVCFDPSFDENCLVNVVAIGICRADHMVRSRVPAEARGGEDYVLILIGKPTDATGFGGAAFASAILDTEHSDDQKGAVQVPDPFLKRVLFEATEVVLAMARSRSIPIGFKDLGAGGISCAAVEQAAAVEMGLDLDLDLEAVDHPERPAEVIACAETQERFALVVPARFADEVLEIYNSDFELPALYPGAGARVIGRVLDDDRFVLRHGGEVVCDLPASLITAGIAYDRKQQAPIKPLPATIPSGFTFDVEATLRTLLGRPNLCSRAAIYHGYDSEVRGRAVVRPGEADAGVIAPVPGADFGLAMAVDGIPAYGLLDPHLAGAHAAYEAMRNVVCVGAEPIALTDCLNYGNPEVAAVFGTFVAGVQGIADAANGIGSRGDAEDDGGPVGPVPIVSGNVSFYNQSTSGSAIAPSPIVACAGRLRSLGHATTLRVKQAGSALFLFGRRRLELGGSEFADAVLGSAGGPLPPLDYSVEREIMYRVLGLIEAGKVLACHDVSTGGLLLTVTEMLLGERSDPTLGATLDIHPDWWAQEDPHATIDALTGVDEAGTPWIRLGATLFGEAPGFVLEVPADARAEIIESLLIDEPAPGVEVVLLGTVTDVPRLELRAGDVTAGWDLTELAAIHCDTLAAALA